MKKKLYYRLLLMISGCIFSVASYSQEMKFEGTHPPNPEVLKLLEREGAIMDSVTNVKERDSLRKEIISDGWFYHGIDGLPINIDGLTKRQTKNQTLNFVIVPFESIPQDSL